MLFCQPGLLTGYNAGLFLVYKLEGPQRQRVESCRILSRSGSVKHLKLKKYTERLILTAVKETKTQKTKYVKQKMYKTKKIARYFGLQNKPSSGATKSRNLKKVGFANRNIGQFFCFIHFLLYVFRLLCLPWFL